ncbi:MAG: hypothetical protein NVSMB9_06510 [Isosphaeraceae bacterium]
MNVLKFSSILGMALALVGISRMATAQEQGGEAHVPRPTAEHKVLTADEGTWDASVKTFLGGPNAEPMVSKGVEINKVMTGGLWLLSQFEGEFGGTSFEGRGQFGYDSLKKTYVGSWIDSMSPTLSVLEGSYDAKTRTMTFVGDGVDPRTKAKYTQKMVTTRKDDGTRVFTLSMKSDQTGGQEAKFMEITYTKRK